METALNIAKYILNKCTIEEHMISNLQLQKIMYIIQRDFLKSFHRPIMSCSFEAWKHGPVIPQIYSIYCGSGANKINRIYDIILDEDTKKYIDFIDAIIELKRDINPWGLVDETHLPGGAWDRVYRNGIGDGDIIPNKLIEEVG